MNNDIKRNGNNGSSSAPLIIIALVLLAAIGGGWWFYSSSKSKPVATSPTKSVTPTPEEGIKNAPPGAQPPNMLGSPTATVTIEEFADYQCPTCAVQHPKMKEITGLYGNRIKFIYRSFPLTQIHKNAYESAVAAEAAGMQGSDKFWAMQNQLFTNQQTWSNSTEARKIFEEYAQKIGLDLAKFQNDMAGLPAKTRVDADLERGRGAGINGTPTIYLNGTKLLPEQTEVSALRQLIDAELQKTSGQSAAPKPPPPNAANTANQSAVGNANTSANSNKK